MQKTVSIKDEKSFYRLYKRGKYSGGRYFTVFTRKNGDSEHNRLGIVVSKKTGNSVQRNRIRRLVRECYRLSEQELSAGNDILISAREAKREAATRRNRVKAVSLPDFYQVKRELERHFKNLSLYKDKTVSEGSEEHRTDGVI